LCRSSALDKDKKIDTYKEGQDLARQLKISNSAARGFIFRYRKNGNVTTGQHGGHKKTIISAEVGNQLLEFVDDHPTCILDEIKPFLVSIEKNCSQKTISQFLHGQLFSIKKLVAAFRRGIVNASRIPDIIMLIDTAQKAGKCANVSLSMKWDSTYGPEDHTVGRRKDARSM